MNWERVNPETGARTPESFESLSRRNAAAEILQSYERLSWYSFQRGESLAQTRTHFRNIVAGLTEEDEMKTVTWEEDFTPHPSRPGEEFRGGHKGKERLSLGANREGRDDARSNARSKPEVGPSSEGTDAKSRKKRKSGMDSN